MPKLANGFADDISPVTDGLDAKENGATVGTSSGTSDIVAGGITPSGNDPGIKNNGTVQVETSTTPVSGSSKITRDDGKDKKKKKKKRKGPCCFGASQVISDDDDTRATTGERPPEGGYKDSSKAFSIPKGYTRFQNIEDN